MNDGPEEMPEAGPELMTLGWRPQPLRDRTTDVVVLTALITISGLWPLGAFALWQCAMRIRDHRAHGLGVPARLWVATAINAFTGSTLVILTLGLVIVAVR